MEKISLFEMLQGVLGCDYISNLAVDPYNRRARKLMSELELTQYPLRELSDAAEYLYSTKCDFQTIAEAEAFFLQRKAPKFQSS